MPVQRTSRGIYTVKFEQTYSGETGFIIVKLYVF